RMAAMEQQQKHAPLDGDALAIARLAVDIAEDKQARDILLLDVRGLCSYADAFVFLTAESKRQVEALRDEMSKGLREAGRKVLHTEGDPDSGWVLMDFSEVIVHIFG